ncbi:uncharacterized protein LOC124811033 [Hydra vulgaris]|uniref:uncharacterized protein LOC124811033 n=1 Tax=Hydra vulgaris TaxID=6087 RepID=UPI001F5FBD86|nr:uncharacterized protein LOC124811033 [Hydra vulgaris]
METLTTTQRYEKELKINNADYKEPKQIGLLEHENSITIDLYWLLGEDEIPLKLTVVLTKENEYSEIVIQEIGKTLFELRKQSRELKNENYSMKNEISHMKNESSNMKNEITNMKNEIIGIKNYFAYYNVNIYCNIKRIIYQDIFAAENKGIIKKVGNPPYDDTSYARKSEGKEMIQYGSADKNSENGAKIIIPDGYNILWIRIPGNRTTLINATFNDGNRENIGKLIFGQESISISSESIPNDELYKNHIWVPIPVKRSGNIILVSGANASPTFYISGIAFGFNIWNIAYNSALAYISCINGGSNVKASIVLSNVLVCFVKLGSIGILYVPVIPSKYDKLLYFVLYNDNNEIQITKLTVNDKVVDTFSYNYDNPIARRYNEKTYFTYYATLIPKEVIPEDSFFVKVEFDMTNQVFFKIYIRECGTHDNIQPSNIQ